MTREELNNKANVGARANSKLQYSDFRKIILDFQLQEHERFLIKFTNLFKSVDNDQDGVISEIQFKDLLSMMNVLDSEEEIENLLAQVDPFNNKKMTYSDVVLVLSSHMVPRDPLNPNPSQQIALLEKFIQENTDDPEGQLGMVGENMTGEDLGGYSQNQHQFVDQQDDGGNHDLNEQYMRGGDEQLASDSMQQNDEFAEQS